MKRRQFLKMIPVGVLSAFIPFKSDTIIKGTPVKFNVKFNHLDIIGEYEYVLRIDDELDEQYRGRIFYKLRGVTYV